MKHWPATGAGHKFKHSVFRGRRRCRLPHVTRPQRHHHDRPAGRQQINADEQTQDPDNRARPSHDDDRGKREVGETAYEQPTP